MVPTYLPIYLSTYLPTCLPAYLPTCLPPYLPTSLPPYLPTSLPPYLSTSLPPYLPTSLLPYLPTSLPRAGSGHTWIRTCTAARSIFIAKDVHILIHGCLEPVLLEGGFEDWFEDWSNTPAEIFNLQPSNHPTYKH